MERIASHQAARPWRYLGAAALVTAISGVVASGLRFDSSYEALLPVGSPEVRNMDAVRARTGGTRQLVIAVGGGDRERRLDFAKRLLPRLGTIEGTRFVDLEFPVGFFRDRGLLLMDSDRLDALVDAAEEAIQATKWQVNPFNPHLDEVAEKKEVEGLWQRVEDLVEKERERIPFKDVYESSDGRYVFVLDTPDFKFTDMEKLGRFMSDVKSTVRGLDPASHGLAVRYAGQPELLEEQQETMTRDMRNASLLALVLCVLAVVVVTRRPITPVAIGIPLAAGVAWTFAVVTLRIGHVNIITGFLTSVIIGLGIDFGIHLFIRYQQERRLMGLPPERAMVRAVTRTFQPALTSALTTAGTFATFMIAEFRGFSEFGFIAALGVMLTLLSAFLVLPPLVLVIDRSRWARTQAAVHDPIPRRAIPAPAALVITLVFLAVAVYGGWASGTIRFHNDFKKLRGESPAMEFTDYVDRNLGRRFNPAAVIVESVDDARTVTEIVRKSIEEDRATLLDRTHSIADFLPADVDRRMERIADLAELLSDPKLDRAEERKEKLAEARRLVDVEPWGVEDLPESIRRRFLARDAKGFIVYVWPRSQNMSDEQLFAWQAEIDRLASSLRERGITFAIGDETLIAAWVSGMVREEAPILCAISALVVFGLLLLDFRRVWRSALVATPLVGGMLAFAAAMHVSGQDLNLFNIVIVPSIIGIGIDNSVHIYHRYRLEGAGSVVKVLRLTGMGALLASLTTCLGFGSALVSHHLGLRTMGMIAVTGVSTTFVTATVLFPCILVLIERVVEKVRSRSPDTS